MRSRIDYTELDEKIRRYVNGSLSQQEIDELWVDVLMDPEALDYLKASINLHSIAAEQQHEAAPVYQLGTVYKFVAAAVLIIGLMAGSFLWFQQQSVPAAPQAVDRIELDIMRSAIDQLPSDQQNLQSALALAVEDNRTGAFAILDSLRSDADLQKVQIEATITKGILKYNESNFKEASELFEYTLAYNNLSVSQKERSLWYLTQCYLQDEKYDEARELARRVEDLDGSYYRAAQNLLQQFH